jgi:DNA-binding PadR family transcriptional regulator
LKGERSRYIVEASQNSREGTSMSNEENDSPWDQPWGSGQRRHGGRGARSGWQGGWQSSWQGGPPPWVQGLINLAQQGGAEFRPGRGAWGGHRGPKVRRGDVRAAILDVLAVEPMNGYQIIQQIAERSGGAWKPSPGSVYPTVQQLEDEGLVEGTDGQGRRLLTLSDAGREYVAEHPDELAATWRPFDQAEPPEDKPGDLKPVIGQVMAAVWQVVVSGTKQQQAEAAEILADTRRRLYGLLADGDQEEGR